MKRPKQLNRKPTISVRSSVYDALERRALAEGVTVTSLVERALAGRWNALVARGD
jgi:hypothetical protein